MLLKLFRYLEELFGDLANRQAEIPPYPKTGNVYIVGTKDTPTLSDAINKTEPGNNDIVLVRPLLKG